MEGFCALTLSSQIYKLIRFSLIMKFLLDEKEAKEASSDSTINEASRQNGGKDKKRVWMSAILLCA